MAEVGGQDARLPGSTAFAKSFNQRLAAGARRAIFHHPDDDPLHGLELPGPRDRELRAPDPADFLPRSSRNEE
jgi:hypothetical protein